MAADVYTVPGWQIQPRQNRMVRRYDFASYAHTRGFLDRLAALSEREGFYPDLNFGKTHVNVTIDARESVLGAIDAKFAGEVDALVEERSE
ncbi:MAG: 4a-hydroxytetrahydrobiopterin dehydratase [Thiotrichales bacterium]